MHMDDSVRRIGLFSGVANSRDSHGYTTYQGNCLGGALPYTRYTLSHWVIRSFLLRRVEVLHPARMIKLGRQPWRPSKTKEGYPGCLAHAVIGAFYSVVANRRQPNLHIMNTGVLQHGCQLTPTRRIYMENNVRHVVPAIENLDLDQGLN